MSYVVKYDILPSRTINNTLEPDQGRIKKLEDLEKFFTKLEISILGEGVRNPIVINAMSKDDITPRYGGSRLMIAQKHNLDIPCIIADFDNIFPDSKILSDIQTIYKCFKDRPKKIFLKPHGINMSGCQHVHLKEDEMSWTYTTRYVVIPSKFILNECKPEIRAQNYIDTLNKNNGFYDKLEESILREGIRNPILVWAGYYPPAKITRLPSEMQEDPNKILVCYDSGGSRLSVAQKHNMDIPCIIADFVDRFSEEKILETEQDIFSCYRDWPATVEFNSHGVQITNLPQTHMKNK
ncbi:hypothetical protein LCGC14_0759090 [marine sediment metagenome]|uniref:Uncharacterized protein n=1 Tax=marine sediment metagenome TaxID=412755 RepID=A0A0F9QLM3_9ZZZZ